jgi:signal transduction histidine kinase
MLNKTPLLMIILIFLTAVSAVATYAQSPTAASGVIAIDQSEFSVFAAPGLPDQNAIWHSTVLPFMSTTPERELWQQAISQGYIWFRFALDQPEDITNLSILFWRYNLSMQVYFNGIEIASNGVRQNRLTTAWNRPLLANIRTDRWQPGQNELLVRLAVTAWGGNLAPILLGNHDELQDLQERRLFMQVELNRILLAFALTIGLFTLGLWLLRRTDTVYLWFSGICLTWALGSSHTVIYYNPLPYDIWLPMVHIAIDACIFCLYGFIGRLAGIRKARREAIFLTWIVSAALIHLVSPPAYFWYTAYLSHLIGMLVLAAIIVRVTTVAIKEKQSEAIVLAAAILAQIVLFIFNAFQMFFDNGSGWDGTLVYAHFGIPVLLFVFAAALLRRFTQALATAESLNRELEQKIELSRQIIKQSFEERRNLELRQAAEQERQKIYRDLHDDVGSRLLSMIHTNTDQQVGEMARATLESLRHAVSRANTPDQPLVQLLSDIREESDLRLHGSGHAVEWTEPAVLPDILLPALVAFNLNRIMKELVSNIIRHAKAGLVKIQVSFNDGTLLLIVSDNGCGFEPSDESGNGLRNMRSRATEIGAGIVWLSSPSGTRTQITLPSLGLMEVSARKSTAI